jgi:hypothetical protein
MILGSRAGVRLEIGQLGQGEVDLHHAAPTLPALDVGHEVRRQILAVEVLQERNLGMQGRDQRLRLQLFAVAQGNAHRPAFRDDHALDGGLGSDLAAKRLC